MTGESIIHVLGVGLDPEALTPVSRALVDQAQLVAGGTRLLDALDIAFERRIVFTTLPDFVARLRTHAVTHSICVVADGDPLLWGIGASLLRHFKRHELCFHPHISALQTAAARLGLPWGNCVQVSLHGRNQTVPLFAALTHHHLVAVYTDPTHSPDHIAHTMLERGVRGWRMHVAEALCQPEERVSSVELEQAVQQSWHPLNLIILEQITPPQHPVTIGLDDADLDHQHGLITKQPVRALALSCLRLTPEARFWDLGAGSGAVSLEGATLIRRGEIVAVERQLQRVADIRANLARHGAWLVRPVHAHIESFLDSASDSAAPTHIFLGGGTSPATLHRCGQALQPGGRLVIAAVLLSTLEIARHTLADWPLRIHQLHHCLSQPLGTDQRLVPDNPVFLIETCKPSPSHCA